VPWFYFHLFNDMDVPDIEGIELPDLTAAALRQSNDTVTFRDIIRIEA
jgi:hypothetical protein